jgi:hypothetical protein
MLWFYKAFFPVVRISFVLYWRIKAGDAKSTQRIAFQEHQWQTP